MPPVWMGWQRPREVMVEGVGEMTYFKAISVLAEDLNSVPSTIAGGSQPHVTPAQGILVLVLISHNQTHTHTHNLKKFTGGLCIPDCSPVLSMMLNF